MTAPPDWQMPPGVNRALWDYLHDEAIARRYDASLAGSTLFQADVDYVERHCPGPARLIDLGCGTGRLLIRLAKAGWGGVGVDLSAEMLAEARRRAAEVGVPIDLIQGNLAELDAVADASFDHAACLFSTLGMVVGEEARRRVVGHAFRVLRPGGTFVLHVHNRWWGLRDPVGRRWLLSDLWRNTGDRVMPPQQGVGQLTMHLFTRREATGLLRDAGFRVVDVTPVGLGASASLRCPWLLGGWRASGFLIAATVPGEPGTR
jgi:ubiquinone/menaquinone biosynthesis C-methylase UbiE